MTNIKMKVIGFLMAILSTQVFALELTNMQGQSKQLEALVSANKWTLAVFWSHSCHVCRQEVPEINAFYQKYKGKGTQVIGISIDGEEKKPLVKKFIEDTGMAFPTFIAELPIMSINFMQITGESFRGTPTFLIYNPKGEIAAMQVGKLKMASLERYISERS